MDKSGSELKYEAFNVHLLHFTHSNPQDTFQFTKSLTAMVLFCSCGSNRCAMIFFGIKAELHKGVKN